MVLIYAMKRKSREQEQLKRADVGGNSVFECLEGSLGAWSPKEMSRLYGYLDVIQGVI